MNHPAFRFVGWSCLSVLLVGTTSQAQSAATPTAATTAKPRFVHPQVTLARYQRECRGIPIDESKAAAAIRAALGKPIDPSIEFQNLSLRDAMKLIHDGHGIPVAFDLAALTEAGVDIDATTIEGEKAAETLAAALRSILRPLGLAWTIRDEALTVTTRERADGNLVVYPLPLGCSDTGPVDFQSIIELVQSTVSPPTWNAMGGAGVITPLETETEPLLVVSQTCEIHGEVESLLRRLHDRAFAEFADGRPVLRVHHVADAAKRASLAKQVVAAVDGVVVPEPGPLMSMGMGMGAMPFCWVAREVYGADDPRWIVFRGWMTDEAPRWLRDVYAAVGPDVAAWLRGRPVARATLRRLMDVAVDPRFDGAGIGRSPSPR